MDVPPPQNRPPLLERSSTSDSTCSDVDLSIRQVSAPLVPRLSGLLRGNRLQDIVSGLQVLRIDPSPGRNDYIRYYPPLRELPCVREPVHIDLSNMTGNLSFFLYVPFCTGKCSYCFYPKTVNASEETVDAYIDTVLREIALFRSSIPRSIASFYIGGGTPSYLSTAQLEKLFGGLELPRDVDATMTCEVSPETTSAEKIDALKRLGVTRISMGIQSLDDNILKATGRRYDAKRAEETIRLLGAHIDTYNLDFIYGLEGQGIEDVHSMLRLVTELQPPSVTFYQKWSGMRDRSSGRRKVDAEPLAKILSMRSLIEERMVCCGYEHDSLFRYVKRSEAGCSYSRSVWTDNSCISTGISAYSYINGGAARNTLNMKQYRELIGKGYSPVARAKVLSTEEQATRALIFGLKTAGANCRLSLTAIEQKYGVGCSERAATILNGVSDLGLMEIKDNTVRFTDEGIPFAEQVLATLMERLCFDSPSRTSVIGT